MKKFKYWFMGLSILVSFTGCSTTWINLDNSKANDSMVKIAKDKCKYADKEYALMKEQDMIDYTISIANIKGKAKKEWEEISKEKENKFNDEINSCMKKEGLKKEK